MITSTSSLISPFTIAVDADDIDDLRRRLGAARLAHPLPSDDWSTGIPSDRLNSMAENWAAFDWRAMENRLNDIPQFTTDICGQRIHFVHVKSPVAGARPLLLTHGWPGSFLEFIDLIGPLTNPEQWGGGANDAFDVVIPSLPGFGFSTPLTTSGWTVTKIAEAWVTLMDRLGYHRFAVQGGDIGAAVSPAVGRAAPDRVIGVHVNGGLGGFTKDFDPETLAQLSPTDQDRAARIQKFMQDEFGYIAIQSTRPAVIGVALSDSPIGQLAWMLDKFSAWTWPEETPPEELVSPDFLFGNLSLYWYTRSAASAAYVGYAQADWSAVPQDSGVPSAAIVFAHDVGIRQLAESTNTIVRWTDVDRGGHFAALEEPEALVADIREFLRERS